MAIWYALRMYLLPQVTQNTSQSIRSIGLRSSFCRGPRGEQSRFLHAINHLVTSFNVHIDSNHNNQKKNILRTQKNRQQWIFQHSLQQVSCFHSFSVLNFSHFIRRFVQRYVTQTKIKRNLGKAEGFCKPVDSIHNVWDESLIKWITSDANIFVANLISSNCQVVWWRQVDFGL